MGLGPLVPTQVSTPPSSGTFAQVATLCVGQACSMGSLLLAAGTAGMRRALPNSRVMIHQPSGGFHGQVRGREGRARIGDNDSKYG